MFRIGALTCNDHAKRRNEKKYKNRDVLGVIRGEWARGRPKRLEGGSQRQGESTKTHGRHSSGQGLILSGVRISCQTLATFFFVRPLVRQFALLLSSGRVVRLNTRGGTLLELVQRSSEPQLICGRAPGP